jgi:hypothetical protein
MLPKTAREADPAATGTVKLPSARAYHSETDGGMQILSQEQEQNQVQEPIRGTVRGDAAESGQLLLVAKVEAFT